jgi:hypothetical protein
VRGLIIREPWIGYILEGRKTWEIRSRATKMRGQIALIKGGSGQIVGVANVVDSVGPMTFDQLKRHGAKHCAPAKELGDFLRKYKNQGIAWVLGDVVRLPELIAYRHPSGAVIWVTLHPTVTKTIQRQALAGQKKNRRSRARIIKRRGSSFRRMELRPDVSIGE